MAGTRRPGGWRQLSPVSSALMPDPWRSVVPFMSERAEAVSVVVTAVFTSVATPATITATARPATHAPHHEAQGLLLVEVQRIKEVPQRLDQRGHGAAQGVDLGLQQLLGGVPGKGVAFHEAADVLATGQATQGPAAGTNLVQQLGQCGLLALAQVQEGADAGLQALVAVAVGTQAWTEAVPMTVVTVVVACAMAMSMPVSESREGPDTGSGAGRQLAAGASVKVRAERTEPAIKAVVTMTFMVAAPATKQMHVEIPW